jgi:outer membrane immunogenic protein
MKTRLAALAAFALCTSAALAGGPVTIVDPIVPPPPPPPMHNWTGGWAGVVLGFGNADSLHCDGPGCTGIGPAVGSDGGLAGIALGYNVQSGNMVYGVVLDYVRAQIEGSAPSTPGYGCVGGCVTDITSMATLRGRLGYAMNRSQVFVSAGMASVRGEGGLIGGTIQSFSTTAPVLGLGFETMVGARMSLSGEVLHTLDAGPVNVGGACVAPGCQIDDISTTTARIGLSFRF